MKSVLKTLRSTLAASLVGVAVVTKAQQPVPPQPAPLAVPARTPPPGVLTIGPEHWSAEQFAALRSAGGPADAMNSEQLTRFVQGFADRYLAARQAEAAGLADDVRVAQRLALARDRVLAEEERTRLQKVAPIDAAVVRADFEARPGRYDELRLSHILVRITDQNLGLPPARRRNEAQALALATSIQHQLQRGASFKALARRYSDDAASRAAGGELPVIFGKDLKPEVLPVVKALQSQQVSAPVRAPDGYHLIRLEERSVTDFEGARRLLELELREAWAERQLDRLRSDVGIIFDAAAAQAQEAARGGAPLDSSAGQ